MPSDTEFLTVDELAARYGISKETIYQWNRKKLKRGPPFIRVGRHVRYRLADIEAWEATRIQNQTEATP